MYVILQVDWLTFNMSQAQRGQTVELSAVGRDCEVEDDASPFSSSEAAVF